MVTKKTAWVGEKRVPGKRQIRGEDDCNIIGKEVRELSQNQKEKILFPRVGDNPNGSNAGEEKIPAKGTLVSREELTRRLRLKGLCYQKKGFKSGLVEGTREGNGRLV